MFACVCEDSCDCVLNLTLLRLSTNSLPHVKVYIMSYNNIGLATVRGSGTNGYVQRNFAQVRRKKHNTEYKDEDALRTERYFNRKPNKDILEHNRKREVELKCVEMQDLMEEQGYPDDEIEEKIAQMRAKLLSEINDTSKVTSSKSSDTHAIAAARDRKNEKIGAAFGINDGYEAGSSFNRELQEQRKAERQAEYERKREEREQRDRDGSGSADRRERNHDRDSGGRGRSDARERERYRSTRRSPPRARRRSRSRSTSSNSDKSSSDSDSDSDSDSSQRKSKKSRTDLRDTRRRSQSPDRKSRSRRKSQSPSRSRDRRRSRSPPRRRSRSPKRSNRSRSRSSRSSSSSGSESD